MKSWIQLWNADLVKDRFSEAEEDVHFTEGLVKTFIEEFTSPGQVVLDPFAGYGTALVVAERMGRRAVGVELLKDRAELIRGRLSTSAEVINADSRELLTHVPGPVDLCFTSPPYMTIVNHPENPLNAYETLDGDYRTYLGELSDIFRQVGELLRPGSHLVVNVCNMRDDGIVTPLAWDLARAVSRHLVFQREIFVCWDEQPEWLIGDYCLIFQRADD